MLVDRRLPIVLAPMAGGPTTPELVAAVSGAGGLGFLGAGYKTAAVVEADVAAVRALTSEPFGVNVFCLRDGAPADSAAVAAYRARLAATEEGELGDARWDDDSYAEKVDLLCDIAPAVVSFTFGCPAEGAIARLKAAGCEVWVTVTESDEAEVAVQAGADVLVVQGVEAGGHRGTFDDVPGRGEVGLLALLQLVRAQVDAPLVATGGIATGEAVAAVLAAGARAAQVGTAYMRCPEAGTSPALRDALDGDRPTALTRAFTGRTARGIVNRFIRDHGDEAPSAYPEIHHITAPLRARGREAGDADMINLWAGQAHELATDEPAGELTRRLARDAQTALERAAAYRARP